MKWIILAIFVVLCFWVALSGPLGYDVGLQGIVELLGKALTEIVNFFAKLLEGLP